MSNEETLKRRLDDLEHRVRKLELLRTPSIKKTTDNEKPLTLAQHILALRNTSFFSQPRSAVEVHKKINNTYSCVLNRVEVALVRMATKKQLRKATKVLEDKSYKAYVW